MTDEHVDTIIDDPAIEEETPEVEVNPEIEAKEEAQESIAPKEEEKQQNNIPLAVHLEERKARQEAERRAQDLEAKFGGLYEQVKEIREAKNKPEAPNPEEDPLGFLQHQLIDTQRQLQELQGNVTERTTTLEQNQQAQQQMQQVASQIRASESEYIKETPDYYEALNYMRDLQARNLQSYGVTAEQARQNVDQAELQAAIFALQNGINPAQAAYQSAVNLGYQKTNGKAAEEAKETVERLKKGEKAAQTAGDSSPSLDDLIDMEDEVFDEAFKEMFGQ